MLDLLIGSFTGLLKEVVPDADKRAAMAHEVATMAQKHAHEAALSQIKLNKAEGYPPKGIPTQSRKFLIIYLKQSVEPLFFSYKFRHNPI